VSKPDNNQDSVLAVTLTVGQLREIIRQEVQQASNGNGHHNEDYSLGIAEAAKMLKVSRDWLYKHYKTLPFARKLGSKMLRFSHQGIQAYLKIKPS